jgi:dTDP-4-amino-4,6-dideoxygalactose transaminase
MGRRYGSRRGQCPVAEDVSERLVRLPFYTALTESEQAEVIETVCAVDG